MSVRLGMFTMPFHRHSRDYTTILKEDREAIVLADKLDFSEVFVGEHFTSWSEPVSSPLMFLSTVIDRTQKIRFGTVSSIFRKRTHSLSRHRPPCSTTFVAGASSWGSAREAW